LKQQAGKTALEERLEIQVFRRIIDEVPLELLTGLRSMLPASRAKCC